MLQGAFTVESQFAFEINHQGGHIPNPVSLTTRLSFPSFPNSRCTPKAMSKERHEPFLQLQRVRSFGDEWGPGLLRTGLEVFLLRFIQVNQFKGACLTNTSKVGSRGSCRSEATL